MKNLKILLVFFVLAGIASCSNDDDGNEPITADPIVGKWKLQQQFMDGEEFELTECEKRTTVEFISNGNINSTDFSEDFETEECVSEISAQKWENRGNNVYRITEGNISYDVTIMVSNNSNTLTISSEDDDGSYSMRFVRV